MQSFNPWLISSTSFGFSGYLVLYAVGEKKWTVKQTSMEVVLSLVWISLLFIGIPEIGS